MSKSNFLLVDLNEPKTKKLVETITSETSRKILIFLAEKDDTEQNIAQAMQIPISTVHYHLQKLQEAGLVTAEEFHYSPKGRDVNHYKLTNKYIIIAPRKVIGLREKLKGILPVALIVLGISGIIKLVQLYLRPSFSTQSALVQRANEATVIAAEKAVSEAVTMSDEVAEGVGQNISTVKEAVPTVMQQPDIALWFLIVGITCILLYILFLVVKEKIKK